MDAINRKVAIQQLMDAAQGENRTAHQFIFITPHDLSVIKPSPTVKKLKMKPLEKDFGRAEQQTLDAHMEAA